MYRPLKDCLTIHTSNIEGLGLFATKFIQKNTYLGITHIKTVINDREHLIRTPLGGFYNHSVTPNCTKIKYRNYYVLKTLRNIHPGEEITVTYTFYNI